MAAEAPEGVGEGGGGVPPGGREDRRRGQGRRTPAATGARRAASGPIPASATSSRVHRPAVATGNTQRKWRPRRDTGTVTTVPSGRVANARGRETPAARVPASTRGPPAARTRGGRRGGEAPGHQEDAHRARAVRGHGGAEDRGGRGVAGGGAEAGEDRGGAVAPGDRGRDLGFGDPGLVEEEGDLSGADRGVDVARGGAGEGEGQAPGGVAEGAIEGPGPGARGADRRRGPGTVDRPGAGVGRDGGEEAAGGGEEAEAAGGAGLSHAPSGGWSSARGVQGLGEGLRIEAHHEVTVHVQDGNPPNRIPAAFSLAFMSAAALGSASMSLSAKATWRASSHLRASLQKWHHEVP